MASRQRLRKDSTVADATVQFPSLPQYRALKYTAKLTTPLARLSSYNESILTRRLYLACAAKRFAISAVK